jgi:hypothetical protein
MQLHIRKVFLLYPSLSVFIINNDKLVDVGHDFGITVAVRD